MIFFVDIRLPIRGAQAITWQRIKARMAKECEQEHGSELTATEESLLTPPAEMTC